MKVRDSGYGICLNDLNRPAETKRYSDYIYFFLYALTFIVGF